MTKYDKIYTIGQDIKNIGYDYSGNILRNSLSSYLYLDTRIAGFLGFLENAVTKLFNSTKRVHHYFNFTIDENKIETAR